MNEPIQQPVGRVVVIGAGIAGLTVARRLTEAGVDCVVLEARDRIGGRLHTVQRGGHPLDLGGSWIHHPLGNPLRALADEVGVTCRPGYPLDSMSWFDLAEGRRLDDAEVAASLVLQDESFPAELARTRELVDAEATAAQAIDAFVESAGLAEDEARRARQVLRSLVEADAAGRAEDESWRWMWTEEEFGGELFGDLPEGGYGALVTKLADGVDVRLSTEVTHVDVTEAAVRVSGPGCDEKGTHAVVAVPLGVLKADVPEFTPALPLGHADAIERLGFGPYEKVALTFAEPWWEAAGLSHLVLFPKEPDLPATWVFDERAFGNGPTLTAHVFASNAPHLTDGDRLFAMLAQAAGREVPAPVAVTTTSWTDDPYSRGAYTHVPPGADPSLADLLGQPVGGRLLLAGEHTQSARLGYADGAMSSGSRVVSALLGPDRVRL